MGAKKAARQDGQHDTQSQSSTLPAWVQQKLEKSGITLGQAVETGIRLMPSEECARFLGKDPRKNPVPDAILIPYHNIDGKPIQDNGKPYCRSRFRPGSEPEWIDEKGKAHRQKYAQMPGTNPHVYIPLGLTKALKHFPVLIITEGEIKALSGTVHGIPTVGLGGIQSWGDPDIRFFEKEKASAHQTPVPGLDEKSPIHPELMAAIEAAKAAGVRKILVLGDSDGRVERDATGAVTSGNPAVESAVKKLAKAIQWQGGDIEVFRGFCPLPASENSDDNDKKAGLDDWIVADGALAVKETILNRMNNRAISFAEKEHLPLAKWFRQRFQQEDTHGLLRWREDFYSWTGKCWQIVENKTLQATLHEWLEGLSIYDKKEGLVPPTRALVENVWATLERITHVATALDAPFRMSDPPAPIGAGKFIVLANGVLDIESRKLFPPSVELFSPNVLPYAFDPEASCPEWNRFLSSLWPDDPEAIRLLKQWAGYLLSGSTHLQKILFLLGPKRAGKGTILRVLTHLLGPENVTSATLARLGSSFGLAPLMTKTLAFFPDARLTGGTEQGPIVETLLSISGEDSLAIDRKYRDVITAKIPARLVLVSNELPRLQDASGALASRFLLLKLTRSFYGEEDTGLADRLLKELPGILNWGLVGLADLKKTGRFTEPKSGKELAEDMHRLASPVAAFIADCCLTGPNFRVRKTDLFSAWKQWTEENGHHAGSVEMFSRNLQAACQVQPYRPKDRDSHHRPNFWIGLGLTLADHHDEGLGQAGQATGQATDSPQTRIGQGGSTGSGIFEKDSFQGKSEGGKKYVWEEQIGNQADPPDPPCPKPFSEEKQLDPPTPEPIPDDSVFDLDAFLRDDS